MQQVWKPTLFSPKIPFRGRTYKMNAIFGILQRPWLSQNTQIIPKLNHWTHWTNLFPWVTSTSNWTGKEPQVYARRNKPQEVIEIPNLLEQSHESEPISENSGNNIVDEHTYNDLDVPIAIRNGVRECTKHAICNFISYAGLSPTFGSFATNLVDIEIPQNIYTALRKP